MKRCYSCKLSLPESAYYRNRTTPDGLAGTCASCARRQNYESYRRVKERDPLAHHLNNRANSRRWLYGLTPERFDAMKRAQHDACAICHTPFDPTGSRDLRAAVDHCHERGHVRGLLCGSCNKGLGCFRDNVKTLTRAIEYLEESL